MTPIHPDQRSKYPDNWKLISARIRFERAAGRCECQGECGINHKHEWLVGVSRCGARHGKDHVVTGSRVVLTVAHLDHNPAHCKDDNLRAMCQRCHLSYDRDHHAAERARRRAERSAN